MPGLGAKGIILKGGAYLKMFVGLSRILQGEFFVPKEVILVLLNNTGIALASPPANGTLRFASATAGLRTLMTDRGGATLRCVHKLTHASCRPILSAARHGREALPVSHESNVGGAMRCRGCADRFYVKK